MNAGSICLAYLVNSRHAYFERISFLRNNNWRRLPEQCCREPNGEAILAMFESGRLAVRDVRLEEED